VRRSDRPRAARTALAVVLVAAALLTGIFAADTTDPAPSSMAGGTDLELAADIRQFKAGNIISDVLFYDGNAMSASAVQRFLNAKNPSCTAGAKPCLKRFKQTTKTRAATSYCNRYGGAANETAATIIHKVGRACGISQRALLVMLQKEQGLVRASGSALTARRYEIAMGYGCPDTAACDSLYYGFFNQLYSAAAQFKRYAANPKNYGKRPYTTNTIYWTPIHAAAPRRSTSRTRPRPACTTTRRTDRTRLR
jgi:hypothetical protein